MKKINNQLIKVITIESQAFCSLVSMVSLPVSVRITITPPPSDWFAREISCNTTPLHWCLAHKKLPPPKDHQRSLGIVLP